MPHQTQNTRENCSRYRFANLLTCQLFRSLAEFSLDLSALSYKLAIHFNIFVQLGLQSPLSKSYKTYTYRPYTLLHCTYTWQPKTGSFSPNHPKPRAKRYKNHAECTGKKMENMQLGSQLKRTENPASSAASVFTLLLQLSPVTRTRAQAKGPWQWRS